MAFTEIFNSLRVNTKNGSATATFHYDSLADIPLAGSAADWVKDLNGDEYMPPSPTASGVQGWYHTENYKFIKGAHNLVTVEARQPGKDWTWAGLHPIEIDRPRVEMRHFYVYGGTLDTNVAMPQFSNWEEATGSKYQNSNSLIRSNLMPRGWRLEWISANEHADMFKKVNPASNWPAGFPDSPIKESDGSDTSIYWCDSLDIQIIRYNQPSATTATKYYRHVGLFVEAPVYEGTQLIWDAPSWSITA